MYERLAKGEPRLVEVLSADLSDVIKTMVSTNDEVQLRRAQGRAQELQRLIGLLDHYRKT